LRRYKAKRVKTRCYQGGRSVWTKISGGRGRPWGIFFGFYKTREIVLSDRANCTVLYVQSFWHNTGAWQTDGRTELP